MSDALGTQSDAAFADQQAAQEAALPDDALCATCGAIRTGPWCSQCGQELQSGRHTLRRLVAGGLGRVIGLDGGFLHTAIGLTVAPHRVVGDYLAGRTVRYTHPFAYLVITFAAFALIGEVLSVNVSGAGASNRALTALVVPFVALVSRVVFLRGRFNLAEHLILVVYLFAQIALLLAGLQVLVPFLGLAALRVLLLGALVAGAAYFVWAYSRIFRARPVWAGIGALAALWGGIVLWASMLILLVRLTQR